MNSTRKILTYIKTSYIYGLLHSKHYWRTHRNHIVNFPEKDGKIIENWRDLKEVSPLKYFYMQKIVDFVRTALPEEIIFLGCSYGHEVLHTHKEFPDIKVIGVDCDREAIEYCNGLGMKNADFILADLTDKNSVDKLFESNGLRRAVIAIETMYFLPPKAAQHLIDTSAREGIEHIKLHSNTNINNTGYDIWVERKSRYSGIHGAWDHSCIEMLKKHYFIYKVELLDQRLRTKGAHYYQQPWLITSRLRGSWKNNFFT